MAENDDEIFMARSINVTPKTTEQHLIVTNNKRLRSTFRILLKANY